MFQTLVKVMIHFSYLLHDFVWLKLVSQMIPHYLKFPEVWHQCQCPCVKVFWVPAMCHVNPIPEQIRSWLSLFKVCPFSWMIGWIALSLTMSSNQPFFPPKYEHPGEHVGRCVCNEAWPNDVGSKDQGITSSKTQGNMYCRYIIYIYIFDVCNDI